MNFKKWVKSIETAAYNGARTVYETALILAYEFQTFSHPTLNIVFYNETKMNNCVEFGLLTITKNISSAE